MSARLPLALLLLLAGSTLAAAQPIPNSALPGREREQFGTSPMERYMQPGVPARPPVVTTPTRHRTCRVKGSSKRVRC